MAGKRGVNKKWLYLVATLVAVVVAVISALASSKPEPPVQGETENSNFQVHYIDVGQGDCSLVVCDGQTLLIDAGENGHETEVINYLRSLGIEKLDYIIATHPHSDHIGGLPEVIEEFGMDNIIMPRLTKEQTPTTKTYTRMLEEIKASGAKVISAKVGSTYALGEASFEILGPVSNSAEDLNSMSVVAKVTHGENSFLFTGDAESDEEREIIGAGVDLDADVLKMGHHGSNTSSCKEFLAEVTPEICVIMCGEDNDYGHPHKEPLERLKKYTNEIYRTDICGSIVISSNGETMDINYENQ